MVVKKRDYLKAKKEKSRKSFDLQDSVAEREALELILSENIIKPQFVENQILIKIYSKTKSF